MTECANEYDLIRGAGGPVVSALTARVLRLVVHLALAAPAVVAPPSASAAAVFGV